MDLAGKIAVTVCGLTILSFVIYGMIQVKRFIDYFDQEQKARQRKAYKATGTDWSKFEKPARKPIIDPVKGMLPRGGESED